MSGFDNTSFTVRTATGTTDTLTNNDSVVIYTNTSAKTVNLPAVAAIQPGRRYVVINAAAGAITLDAAGSETIDGATTKTVAATTGRADLVSDGTQWFTAGSVGLT